jgi:anti-sigma factor RsiW
MKSHNEVRGRLPLAAAGALTRDEQVEVEAHMAQCPECREEFARLEALRMGLANLPSPSPPPFLAQKTAHIVRRRLEAVEERRWRIRTIAFLVAFTWVVTLAAWPVVRWVAGIEILTWLLYSTVWGWLTAGCAALILGLHAKHTREEL